MNEMESKNKLMCILDTSINLALMGYGQIVDMLKDKNCLTYNETVSFEQAKILLRELPKMRNQITDMSIEINKMLSHKSDEVFIGLCGGKQ